MLSFFFFAQWPLSDRAFGLSQVALQALRVDGKALLGKERRNRAVAVSFGLHLVDLRRQHPNRFRSGYLL
jgi:hypothetical protein